MCVNRDVAGTKKLSRSRKSGLTNSGNLVEVEGRGQKPWTPASEYLMIYCFSLDSFVLYLVSRQTVILISYSFYFLHYGWWI